MLIYNKILVCPITTHMPIKQVTKILTKINYSKN